jgi:hypothetical protein
MSTESKRSVILSFLYSVAQITQGLLLHPYQTMQSLVREHVFIWMSMLPMVVLAMVTIAWKWGLVPLVRLVTSCQALTTNWGTPICDVLPFISNWITFFCLFWQVMLLYLLYRFTWVFKEK